MKKNQNLAKKEDNKEQKDRFPSGKNATDIRTIIKASKAEQESSRKAENKNI